MTQELLYKDDLVKAALSSFEANHRLAKDEPDTYPHIDHYAGYFDADRDCAVVEYSVDSGQSVEERAILYSRDSLGL